MSQTSRDELEIENRCSATGLRLAATFTIFFYYTLYTKIYISKFQII